MKGARMVHGGPTTSDWDVPVAPPRVRPLLRLVLVAFAVLVIDAVTGEVSRRGITFDFPTVSAIRLAVAPLIARYPLSGFALALEADKWDWYWLGMPHQDAIAQAAYQRWDKLIDLVHLGIAAAMTLRWPDWRARNLAIAMFAWRLLGVVAFLEVESGWMLLIFPNTFESLFLLYVIFRMVSGQAEMLQHTTAATLVGIALLIPKVGEEYVLHVWHQRPWAIVHIVSPVVDAWLWGAAMYALPLIALVVLVATARGPATRGDPETQMSAV